MKTLLSIAAIFALLTFPEISVNAVREAMHTWYRSVAPALFPFMVLMPMLTSPQSARVYELLFGRVIRLLLKLPGAAAPAIVIAMTAGSPAGAITAAGTRLSNHDKRRIVLCTCGFSPAFLVTGIGVTMLGSAADGHILLRSQIFSQLALLLFTRRSSDEPLTAPAENDSDENPIRSAVFGVLTVCGYMAAFSTAAAILTRLIRNGIAGTAVLCILDLPSGAAALAKLVSDRNFRLLLLSAAAGLGGICIAVQNLSVCRGIGLHPMKYFAARIAHAGLMTAAAWFQIHYFACKTEKMLPAMEISALISAILIIPMLFFWKKNLFLNKRKSKKTARISSGKREKTQYIEFINAANPQHLVK